MFRLLLGKMLLLLDKLLISAMLLKKLFESILLLKELLKDVLMLGKQVKTAAVFNEFLKRFKLLQIFEEFRLLLNICSKGFLRKKFWLLPNILQALLDYVLPEVALNLLVFLIVGFTSVFPSSVVKFREKAEQVIATGDPGRG